MPAWRRQQRYFCLSDASCGSSGQVASSRSSRHAALCALASLVAFAVAVPLPHTHTSFVSRRDKGKGSDANDDYSNDAAWHPAPSRTLQFGTPREGSKTAKKGASNSRLLFCRTAHVELCVQWHFLVQTCECWRPSACHAQRLCSLRGVSFPKRHARPPPMVQAVALLLP